MLIHPRMIERKHPRASEIVMVDSSDAELAANAATSRPIFATEGFEDIDESCTHGAYIGGMAVAAEDAGLATSYMRAADMLVERALRDDCVHEVVLPALFLYRHVLELRLKFAVRPAKLDHGLEGLARELDVLLTKKGGRGLAPGLLERVEEIRTSTPMLMRSVSRTRRSRSVRPVAPTSRRKSG